MERLFIAEKPKMALAIAECLGIKRRHSGYIECDGDTVITWCIGHILQQFMPEQYDPKFKHWNLADLPIIPEKWKVKPTEDKKAQFDIIAKLAAQAENIVNSADCDREGQLIVDEILNYIGYKGPTQRLWITALDQKSINKGLEKLHDNQRHRNLSTAALARSRADWLIGLNLTRGITVAANNKQLIAVGRVQTPTLRLVVDRDHTIENFRPKDFFVLNASLRHQNGTFQATLDVQNLPVGLDSEGALVDESVANQIKAESVAHAGTIIQRTVTEKKVPAPLPHNLSDLQKIASDQFGYGAKKTLELCQSLYDKKNISYPRTDCRYLPDEQFADATQILNALANLNIPGAIKADPAQKSAAWNTKKLDANGEPHHGIIPTGQVSQMDTDEQNIFRLIAIRYVKQFLPPYVYMSQKIVVEITGRQWIANGQVVKVLGWMEINQNDEKKIQRLPSVQNNDLVDCTEVKIEAKKTKPPARFSEGSLIEAMANIHKFVDDPKIKSKLKETSGIGTQATRANIISDLLARKYIEAKGKKAIQSTQLGREIIGQVPASLKDPGTTALWEEELGKIVQDPAHYRSFMTELVVSLQTMIDDVKDCKFSAGINGTRGTERKPRFCECGHQLRRLQGKKGFFWACTSPDKTCPLRSDNKGKPGDPFDVDSLPKAPCPEYGCTEQMTQKKSRSGKFYWVCGNQTHSLRSDNNGAPGEKFIDVSTLPESECLHPKCKKMMRRHESSTKKGLFYWKCPTKSHPLYFDDHGKPGKVMAQQEKRK